MKVSYCIECGNETNQQDSHCVVCKTGVRQMHDELNPLLTADKSGVHKLRRNSTIKGDSVSTSSNKKTKAEIQRKESLRDLTITKICDTCGKKYHPQKKTVFNKMRKY